MSTGMSLKRFFRNGGKDQSTPDSIAGFLNATKDNPNDTKAKRRKSIFFIYSETINSENRSSKSLGTTAVSKTSFPS